MTTRFVVLSSRRSKRSSILGLALSAATVFGPIRPASSQIPEYVVTELTDEDATQAPSKMNNLGDIVGRKAPNGKGAPRATLWSKVRSTAKHLGVFSGGDYSSATGINDAGEIVGVSNTGITILPFIWTENGGLRRVPLLSGDNSGKAISINKYGHVVGDSSGPGGSKAFLWTRKTGPRTLSVLPGGNHSTAHDLNDFDEVAGVSASSDGEHAVLWTSSGSVQDLGTLPGDSSSEALAINNAGDVVGSSKGPSGRRAFVWTKSSGMVELGILPGATSSRAMDINDSGVVVGSSGERAFVWQKELGMLDLNGASSTALGILLVQANAINNKGEILAEGNMMHGTTQHQICSPAPPLSFLLTPVTSP